MLTRGVTWRPPDPATGLWVKNPWLIKLISWRDCFLPKSKKTGLPSGADKILFCLGGHLGDAVNSLYVIRACREAFPYKKIYILAPRWMEPVLEQSLYQVEVFWLDSVFLNRSKSSWIKKLWVHLADSFAALVKLRRIKIDCAFDFYYHWPNSSILLWMAAIPFRFGYISGGAGKLYTTALPWVDRSVHVTTYMSDLLRVAGWTVPMRKEPLWKKTLFESSFLNLKSTYPSLRGGYAIIHPGAGARMKEWPAASWKKLCPDVASLGLEIVFTGSGPRESVLCEELCSERGSLNLCGKLTFPQYLAVMANAAIVLGVDSLSGHIAAAVGVRSISLFAGVPRIEHWHPYSDKARVLTHFVPCAPCFQSRGCLDMECLREISPADVINCILKESFI